MPGLGWSEIRCRGSLQIPGAVLEAAYCPEFCEHGGQDRRRFAAFVGHLARSGCVNGGPVARRRERRALVNAQADARRGSGLPDARRKV